MKLQIKKRQEICPDNDFNHSFRSFQLKQHVYAYIQSVFLNELFYATLVHREALNFTKSGFQLYIQNSAAALNMDLVSADLISSNQGCVSKCSLVTGQEPNINIRRQFQNQELTYNQLQKPISKSRTKL